MHFHVDGALGAFARLSPRLADRLDGIERADSLAFDFHKWAQVPYDAGFLLTRDERWQYATFAADNAYLQPRRDRRLPAATWWPCDTGPDLSRGFRALKTWFTLKTYGLDALGATIDRHLRAGPSPRRPGRAEPRLELAAPPGLNVVCFRPARDDDGADVRPHRRGAACRGPGRPLAHPARRHPAIRACIVNHRTTAERHRRPHRGRAAAGGRAWLIPAPGAHPGAWPRIARIAFGHGNLRPLLRRVAGPDRHRSERRRGTDRPRHDPAEPRPAAAGGAACGRDAARAAQRAFAARMATAPARSLLALRHRRATSWPTPRWTFCCKAPTPRSGTISSMPSTRGLADLPPHDATFLAVAEAPGASRDACPAGGHCCRTCAARVLNGGPGADRRPHPRRRRAACWPTCPARVCPPTHPRDHAPSSPALAAGRAPPKACTPASHWPLVLRPSAPMPAQGWRRSSTQGTSPTAGRDPTPEVLPRPLHRLPRPARPFAKARVVLIGGRPYPGPPGAVGALDRSLPLGRDGRDRAERRAAEAATGSKASTTASPVAMRRPSPPCRPASASTTGASTAPKLPDGRLLIFEIDTALIVHDMDDFVTFPYKAPAMRRLFNDFREHVFTF